MAAGAERVLGHNLLDHDLPVLARVAPGLRLLGKQVVDTLYLSPLAFPENPYHRLVKDYKLVRDAVNDPVADARLAASVFRDQWESFSRMAERRPERLAFYAFCLEGRGLETVFTAISGRPAMTASELPSSSLRTATVRKMTGTRRSAGSSRSWAATSPPPTSGIMTSLMTRSGLNSRAASRARVLSFSSRTS